MEISHFDVVLREKNIPTTLLVADITLCNEEPEQLRANRDSDKQETVVGTVREMHVVSDDLHSNFHSNSRR